MEIEHVPGVAEGVGLGADGGRGFSRHLELQEPLTAVAARLEAEPHDAGAGGRGVGVARLVLDLVADRTRHRVSEPGRREPGS